MCGITQQVLSKNSAYKTFAFPVNVEHMLVLDWEYGWTWRELNATPTSDNQFFFGLRAWDSPVQVYLINVIPDQDIHLFEISKPKGLT